MNNCITNVDADFVDAIVQVETKLRYAREATSSILEQKLLKLLLKGVKFSNIEVTEKVQWIDGRRFNYDCKVRETKNEKT